MYASAVSTSKVRLDLTRRSKDVQNFEQMMRSRVVSQDAAVDAIVRTYTVLGGGMANPSKPLATLLFSGPTGTGKTFVFETAAEILFGAPDRILKIDCAEFQHSHEISKLLGAPPSYLGHQETPAMLTQNAVDKYQTDKDKFSFIVFDEIEKAHEALWQLMLGILDKGNLTLGSNKTTDFSQCVIGITTNLGAAEMSKLSTGLSIGLVRQPSTAASISKAAADAIAKNFSPEFMNRIDESVVFQPLSKKNLLDIASRELSAVQSRIVKRDPSTYFALRWTTPVLDYLLAHSADTDSKNARPIKRCIERDIVHPLAIGLSTGQIPYTSTVIISVDKVTGGLVFDMLEPAP